MIFYHIGAFMIGEMMDSQGILTRLMSAYGVGSQKALAERLGIPANNISGWIQRGSVPGNPIIKCALDTETDLRWLVTGEFANANISNYSSGVLRKEKGKLLIDKMLSSGGKAVLQRVMEAYRYKTQKELSDYLGISTATISTWVRREYFPAEVVITCAIDTGVSLEWLAIGTANPVASHIDIICNNSLMLKRFSLNNGQLEENGNWYVDAKFLDTFPESYGWIERNSESWLVDFTMSHISNGKWLISIDGSCEVYNILRIPGGRLQLSSKESKFECGAQEVTCVAKVIKTIIAE